MDAGTAGRLLIAAGAVIAAVGLFLLLGGRLPFGQLPGDISIRRPGGGVFVPLVSCVVISALLTVVLNLVIRR